MTRGLPPFKKVLTLFGDGKAYANWIREMAEGLPEHLDKEPSPQKVDLSNIAFERAIEQAEQGDCSELIRLEKARLKKRPRGAPKKTNAQRLRKTPSHMAAAMVPLAEFVLRQWYPTRPADEIEYRAVEIATTICNDRHPALADLSKKRLEVETVFTYLSRSRKSKQRLR